MSDHPIRKRGAQYGNFNALKHGFYSSRLNQPQELQGPEELQSITDKSLLGEIIMLRKLIKRITSHIEHSNDLPLTNLLGSLSTLAHATVSLASLFRTENALGISSSDQVHEALMAALAELEVELNLSSLGSQTSKPKPLTDD
jgi:hypothetical protein